MFMLGDLPGPTPGQGGGWRLIKTRLAGYKKAVLLRVGIAANTRQMGRDKLDEVVRNREEHGA